MATFVLVHGAWEAGWVWLSVEQHLRSSGHEVFRPSLTGLGERSHLLSPSIDLHTHIADILGLIKWERLKNVTLVGHSYGGMVVTGVADQMHDCIGSLMYLDAFMPKDGQSLLDLLPSERADGMLTIARERGEGWYMPADTVPSQHVTETSEAELLKELCVAHPFATFSQKLNLSDNHFRVAKKTFVLASGYAPNVFAKFADDARALGWPIEAMETHHFPMLSMSRQTAEMLIHHAA